MQEGVVVLRKSQLKSSIERYLKVKYGKTLKNSVKFELYNALSLTILENIVDDWNNTTELYGKGKQAYYMSAEFLEGRALGNNLINLGIYDEVLEVLEELNIKINDLEETEQDAGLGNGGLGRLAACFMDSAASMDIPLTGYGIRYNNGLFDQVIQNGFQEEDGDYWLKYGDPWSIRKDSETVLVSFDDMKVKAIPYDMPIIGYKTKNINTLRLWKCEPFKEFDFGLFNDQKYDEALKLKNRAEDISRVLYPNDSSKEGKILRLRQQYLLVSASLKDIIRKHKEKFGDATKQFEKLHAIQLNDTHPTLAIPELIRILVDEENVSFDKALEIAKCTFSYTNHTILAEALEKWDERLIKMLFARIFDIIKEIDKRFVNELKINKYNSEAIQQFKIVNDKEVRMANLAIHVGHAVNGVAKIHSDILKDTELHNWYELYPDKFQNKTNGITPRRWIRLANPELSNFITKKLGSEDWVKDLSLLKNLERYSDDKEVLDEFMAIKHTKKEQLAKYIKEAEGVEIDPNSLFDIQIKRLHEYKRQFLNALYILDLYYEVKKNPSKDMPKVTFIFGAKAFPGYRRAKAIVKFINEISRLINNDKEINGKIMVHFVENYRVSYAEKLCPAADISKQVSTAGKEASGTGNMKLMLNGAPTFGTLDGANVEIVQESGKENNFIFGLTVKEIARLEGKYNPQDYYLKNPSLKRVIDTLIDGTFDDGKTGDFEDLYKSLLYEGDKYYLLADFQSFKDVQDKVFAAYKDHYGWAKKCFLNTCNSGVFSSDRTILQYASQIWGVKKTSAL